MNKLYYVFVPDKTKDANINETILSGIKAFEKAFGNRKTYLVYVHPENKPKLLINQPNIEIDFAKFGSTSGVKIFVSEIDQDEIDSGQFDSVNSIPVF